MFVLCTLNNCVSDFMLLCKSHLVNYRFGIKTIVTYDVCEYTKYIFGPR